MSFSKQSSIQSSPSLSYGGRHSRKISINNTNIIWQDDNSSTICTLCFVSFTIINRKHHCRNCGRLICGNCSSRRLIINNISNIPVRACDDCFNKCNNNNNKEIFEKSIRSESFNEKLQKINRKDSFSNSKNVNSGTQSPIADDYSNIKSIENELKHEQQLINLSVKSQELKISTNTIKISNKKNKVSTNLFQALKFARVNDLDFFLAPFLPFSFLGFGELSFMSIQAENLPLLDYYPSSSDPYLVANLGNYMYLINFLNTFYL